MTRKDIVIIAVLANIGVLALLFMLAFRTEDEKVAEHPEIALAIVQEPAHAPVEVEIKSEPTEDIDALLDDSLGMNKETADDDHIQFADSESPKAPTMPKPDPELPPTIQPPVEKPTHVVQVTVKKGDAL